MGLMMVRAAAATLSMAMTAVPAISQSQFRPTPIEASDPVRKNIDGLVNLLVKGDFQGAAKVLKASAVPGSPAATGADAQIEALKAAFAGGGRQVMDVSKGFMGGEILIMTDKPGVGPAALMVQVETSAPYRIKSVQTMGMGRRSR